MTSSSILVALFASAALAQTAASSRKQVVLTMPGAKVVNDASSIIRDWPSPTRETVEGLVRKYGEPDMGHQDNLFWRDRGPWLQISVPRVASPHSFPAEHLDFLEVSIRYRVPSDKADDVLSFNDGVVLDVPRGVVRVHCDSEQRNLLVLNLVHDIATGRRSAASARAYQKRAERLQLAGKLVPYAMALQFPIQAVPTIVPAGGMSTAPPPAADRSGPVPPPQ